MELAKAIRNNYVFRGVSKQVVNTIAGLAVVRKFEPGDVLVREFEFRGDLIVILEGEAVVKSFGGDLLAEMGPGSVAGEISLIDEQPRSATVVATKKGEAAILNAEALRGVLEMDPQAASLILTNLCRVLCRRLRSMNVHVDALGRDY